MIKEGLGLRDWLTWFGRWAERDEVMKRFGRLQVAFSQLGEQVIAISGRTDLVRRSSGATGRAFAAVEEAFAKATGGYSRLSEAIEEVERELGRGRTGSIGQAERDLKQALADLKALSRRLDEWEALWREAPEAIEGVAAQLADLEALFARAGRPERFTAQMTNLAAYLAKARATLAGGNPTEAKAQVADLRLAISKLRSQVSEDLSAASALAEAEAELERALEVWRRFQAAVEPGSEAPLPAALATAHSALAEAKREAAAGDLDGAAQALFRLREALRAHKG